MYSVSRVAPKTVSSWFAGVPWTPAPVEAYYTDPGAEILKPKEEMPRFRLFTPDEIERTYPGDSLVWRLMVQNLHELAHFIQCADDEVLDPFWGSFPVGVKGLPPNLGLKEVEVFMIQREVGRHVGQFCFRGSTVRFVQELCPGMTEEEILTYEREVQEKWTAQSAWDELERKRLVLTSLATSDTSNVGGSSV